MDAVCSRPNRLLYNGQLPLAISYTVLAAAAPLGEVAISHSWSLRQLGPKDFTARMV